MNTKVCSCCKKTLDYSEFSKFYNAKDGLQSRCKDCSTKANRKYRNRNKDKIEAKRLAKKESNPIKELLNYARHRAKLKQVPFNLKEEDIVLPISCPILGITLKVNKGKKQDDSYSLDRFIPELGYTKGNVQVISFRANALKSDGSLQEFESLVEWMKSR